MGPLQYNCSSWSHVLDQRNISGTLLSPRTYYGPIPVSLAGLIKIHSLYWSHSETQHIEFTVQISYAGPQRKFPGASPNWQILVPQSTDINCGLDWYSITEWVSSSDWTRKWWEHNCGFGLTLSILCCFVLWWVAKTMSNVYGLGEWNHSQIYFPPSHIVL